MQNKKENILLPVYLLVGSDKLKIKIILQRLENILKEYWDLSFNTDVFDCSINHSQEIINACMQMPFASQKKYVLLNNAEKLNKNDIELLTDYIKQPNLFTVLIIVCSKLAKNSKLYKTVVNYNETSFIDCSLPKKHQLIDTVRKIAHSYNASIDYNAAVKLIDLIGEDTLNLDLEIQKLLLSNNNGNINLSQISMEVSKKTEVKPWDFTNAFADKNLSLCLNLFHELPDGSEFYLLPQICKTVKELICVKDLGKNTTLNSISNELHCESWRIKNHVIWSKKFTKQELLNILYEALCCEVDIKSKQHSNLYFENFLIKSLS